MPLYRLGISSLPDTQIWVLGNVHFTGITYAFKLCYGSSFISDSVLSAGDASLSGHECPAIHCRIDFLDSKILFFTWTPCWPPWALSPWFTHQALNWPWSQKAPLKLDCMNSVHVHEISGILSVTVWALESDHYEEDCGLCNHQMGDFIPQHRLLDSVIQIQIYSQLEASGSVSPDSSEWDWMEAWLKTPHDCKIFCGINKWTTKPQDHY